MLLLITIIAGAALTAVGSYIRYVHRSAPFESANFIKLLLASFAVSSGLTFVFVPTTWLILSFSVQGGPLESYLLPGSNINLVLVGSVIGVFAAIVLAIESWFRSL